MICICFERKIVVRVPRVFDELKWEYGRPSPGPYWSPCLWQRQRGPNLSTRWGISDYSALVQIICKVILGASPRSKLRPVTSRFPAKYGRALSCTVLVRALDALFGWQKLNNFRDTCIPFWRVRYSAAYLNLFAVLCLTFALTIKYISDCLTVVAKNYFLCLQLFFVYFVKITRRLPFIIASAGLIMINKENIDIYRTAYILFLSRWLNHASEQCLKNFLAFLIVASILYLKKVALVRFATYRTERDKTEATVCHFFFVALVLAFPCHNSGWNVGRYSRVVGRVTCEGLFIPSNFLL